MSKMGSPCVLFSCAQVKPDILHAVHDPPLGGELTVIESVVLACSEATRLELCSHANRTLYVLPATNVSWSLRTTSVSGRMVTLPSKTSIPGIRSSNSLGTEGSKAHISFTLSPGSVAATLHCPLNTSWSPGLIWIPVDISLPLAACNKTSGMRASTNVTAIMAVCEVLESFDTVNENS